MAIQSQTATFTGVESYVDLTWVDNYTNFRNFVGLSTTDGSVVAIRLTNPADPTLPPDNTGVRVEPSATFSGTVDVVNLEVLP
jgi:hypothetical protein